MAATVSTNSFPLLSARQGEWPVGELSDEDLDKVSGGKLGRFLPYVSGGDFRYDVMFVYSAEILLD